MHSIVDYPTHDQERRILDLDETRRKSGLVQNALPVSSQAEVFEARRACGGIFVDEKLKTYIVSLVGATRDPAAYSDDLALWLRHGASPRATLAILRGSKALAWLRGQDYVSPGDIHAVAPDILRHRIIPSFEAEADNISRSAIIAELLKVVAIP